MNMKNPKSVIKKAIRRFIPKKTETQILAKQLLSFNQTELRKLLVAVITQESHKLSPFEAVKFLLELDNDLYLEQGYASVRYGNGIHSKHRHINYHKFFTSHINSGESVLDIGCSSGELTSDIADAAAPGRVVGIEIEKNNYDKAILQVKKPNLKFVHGDATKDLPNEKFDVITLSNVLEHIEHRPELLSKLLKKYHPNKVLIRVPLFERDWRVPLKKELGIDYRLDNTHFIEFTKETFESEMDKAGLAIDDMQMRWGEIWAVLSPKI